jgi:hypothetical protein
LVTFIKKVYWKTFSIFSVCRDNVYIAENEVGCEQKKLTMVCPKSGLLISVGMSSSISEYNVCDCIIVIFPLIFFKQKVACTKLTQKIPEMVKFF